LLSWRHRRSSGHQLRPSSWFQEYKGTNSSLDVGIISLGGNVQSFSSSSACGGSTGSSSSSRDSSVLLFGGFSLDGSLVGLGGLLQLPGGLSIVVGFLGSGLFALGDHPQSIGGASGGGLVDWSQVRVSGGESSGVSWDGLDHGVGTVDLGPLSGVGVVEVLVGDVGTCGSGDSCGVSQDGGDLAEIEITTLGDDPLEGEVVSVGSVDVLSLGDPGVDQASVVGVSGYYCSWVVTSAESVVHGLSDLKSPEDTLLVVSLVALQSIRTVSSQCNEVAASTSSSGFGDELACGNSDCIKSCGFNLDTLADFRSNLWCLAGRSL